MSAYRWANVARYVQKLIESNGQDMGVCNGYADDSKLDSAVLAWAQNKSPPGTDADRSAQDPTGLTLLARASSTLACVTVK
ncbi:hypothetical protein ACWGDS_39175 [Streptomyces sp. NPDC055059]